jgi:hypothetical protein
MVVAGGADLIVFLKFALVYGFIALGAFDPETVRHFF